MIKRIGRYEVQAELGRGGFGQVFRAFDPTVGRPVAVKTLTASGEQDMLTRFRNEAAATGKLRHPNIVIIYDFGEHEGAPYLVMELLDGEDLERIITKRRSLTLLQKIDIMRQVASGLHHAHIKGIVHRDVKPANIMLLGDGTVKIMDFGIALLVQATAARITPQGSLIGTFPYMSPEQFYGTPSDALTDIFAYGVTCYKLLTGTHPFQAAEMGELMYNIMNKTPVPIRTLNPECPEALEEAVFKTLSKDREARYQSLEDVQFDLEPIILDLRKERVGELLNEARELIQADQLETAQTAVRHVLEIDPGNRTARELRERVQQLLKERLVRPRITALVSAGREQLETRQFDEAIQKFESALRLDKSNPELHSLIAQARGAWEEAQRADRLVEQARQALNRGDLTGAHKNVADALSADPRHAQAETLLASVRDRIEARERERHLADGLSHVKGLMLLQSFDKAIETLTGLQAEYPDSAEVAQLLARARTEQEGQARRRRLQAGTEEAKELLRNRRLAEALERLAQLRSEFPEAAELRDLTSYAEEELRAQKQAEAIRLATAEARSWMEAGHFDAALERLRGPMAEYSGATVLRDLVQSIASAKAEHQRKTALDEAVQQGSPLIAEGRFSEALERIGAFVRAYGDTAALEPLRRQAEEGLGRQRREAGIHKVMRDAQALLDDGRPDSATQVLQQGTVQFPGHPELTNLLGVAQDRLRDQQRAEAISKTITEAESLARARQFDHALQVLDQGLQNYAGAERLLRCREATLASRAAYERDRVRRETLEQARRLQADRKFTEALQLIDSALEKGGEDPALQELKRQIEGEHHAAEAKNYVDQAVEQAQRLLDQGKIQSATQILQAAAVRYPAERAVAELMGVAEARAREQKRANDIATLVRDAEQQVKTKLFDPALHLLDAGLQKHGAEATLVQAREAALAAKTAHEREQAITEVRTRVSQLQAEGRLRDALLALEPALQRFREDSRLLELKKQIELGQEQERRAEQQREQAMSAMVQEAGRLAKNGQFAEAVNALDQGLKQYPGAERLLRARESAVAAQARAAALAQARQLNSENNFAAALEVANAALRKTPADREFQELKRQIESDQEQQRRSEAIDKDLNYAQDLLRSGRAEASLDALRQAAAKYPDEARVSEVLRAAEEELRKRVREQQQREQAISAIGQEADRLVNSGQFAEAVNALEQGLKQYPRADPLMYARESAMAAQARATVLTQARRLHSESEFAAALQVIDAALQKTPANRDFQELKRQIESDQEKQRRLEDIDKALKDARDLLGSGRAEAARDGLRQAAAKYPDEARLSDLLGTVEEELRKQREQALQNVRSQAESLLAQGQQVEAITLLERQFPGERQLQDVLTRARQQLEEKRRQELELQHRREARDQLLALEQKVPATKKPKLKSLADQVHRIAGPYGQDAEIAAIASRIGEQIEALVSAPVPPSKPLPWRQIAVGAGAAAVVVAALIIGPRLFQKTTTPTPVRVTTVPVEIRTDPPGATVHVGGSSCVTPNCRFDLKPGPYQVEARLQGYQPAQQPLSVDLAKPPGVVDLTLQPDALPPPPPPNAGGTQPTNGTLVLRAGIPGALVIVDNVPRGRTDSKGELRLPLEAKTHEVRVEKSGYQTPAQQRVKIAEGRSQPVAFTLVVPKLPSGTSPEDEKRARDQAEEAARQKAQAEEAVRLKTQADEAVRQKAQTDELARLKAQADESARLKTQATQEQTKRAAEELEKQKLVAQQQTLAVRAPLDRFNAAFQQANVSELQQIWPAVPPDLARAIKQNPVYYRLVMILNVTGDAQITGDTASIACELTTKITQNGKLIQNDTKPVTVRLKRSSDHWQIVDPLGRTR